MDSRDIVNLPARAADFRIPYGAGPKQFGDLRVPAGAGPHPVAIVVHGGFWRNRFHLEYMGHLCDSLKQAGIASWNLEYRSVGDTGGGWPGTFEDVGCGAAHLARLVSAHRLDTSRVVTVGHSAGGHLALWLGSLASLQLAGCVSLAGVADLRLAWELKLGNGAVAEFLGGSPDQVPDRYKATDPMELLPLHAPPVLFAAHDDSTVPPQIAHSFAKATRARLVEVEGGHFEMVDPATPQWAAVQAEISRLVT